MPAGRLWPGPDEASDEELLRRLLAKLAIGLSPAVAVELVAPTSPFADATERAAAGLRAALAAVSGDSPADRADAFNVTHRHRRWVLLGVPAQATHLEFRHPYYDDEVVEASLGVPPRLRAGRRAHIDALRLLAPELARVRWHLSRSSEAGEAWTRRARPGAAPRRRGVARLNGECRPGGRRHARNAVGHAHPR